MRRWILVVGWVMLVGGAVVAAEPAPAPTPEDLKKALDEQAKRIDELKTKLDAMAKEPKAPAAENKPGLWTDRISFFGDFRLRLEDVDEDSKRDRERGRMRARVGFKAVLNEETDFQFRLTTSHDGAPASCDETYGEADSKKPIWVDLAYVDYHPAAVPGLNLLGGKMEMPFLSPGKNEMIWDANLTPEGAAVKYQTKVGKVEPFAAAGGFWIEERSDGPDSALFGIQGGVKVPLGGDFYVLGGAGYFDFGNLKGRATLWDPPAGHGNTLDAADNYRYDFNELEAFAEFGFKVLSVPAVVFGDFVKNPAAGAEDQGWAAGLCLGRLKEPGNLAFRYEYREVEKDAVVGLYSERGTDRCGHTFGLEVQAMRNVVAALIFCMDEVGIADGEDEHDYRRVRLQVTVKF